ncbi:hypothetical protein HNY73_000567 [Argiope bruennichi]|uniref:Uncharacterized protein n=1 Tax=Argiope bruennichi TaxID=94029 RepID=A0A8T0G4G3_ARGBR|nr:hypothetical protein HNY73_000567 [Argiope bruennichi]
MDLSQKTNESSTNIVKGQHRYRSCSGQRLLDDVNPVKNQFSINIIWQIVPHAQMERRMQRAVPWRVIRDCPAIDILRWSNLQ